MAEQTGAPRFGSTGMSEIDSLLQRRLDSLAELVSKGEFDPLRPDDQAERRRIIAHRGQVQTIQYAESTLIARLSADGLPGDQLQHLSSRAQTRLSDSPRAAVVWDFDVVGNEKLIDAILETIPAGEDVTQPWTIGLMPQTSLVTIRFVVVHSSHRLDSNEAEQVRRKAFAMYDQIIDSMARTNQAIEELNASLPDLVEDELRRRDELVARESWFLDQLNLPR